MKYIIYNIDVSKFLKARNIFESFRKNITTDQEKAGAVQAFEFCYELAWKTLKRIVGTKGLQVYSPRDCFRESARLGIISDPQMWFSFIDIRNETVHTYEDEIVEKVISRFQDFSDSLLEIVEYIEQNKDEQ